MASTGKLTRSISIMTAAAQGLGEEIAKVPAREGLLVALVDINLDELNRVGKEIDAASG